MLFKRTKSHPDRVKSTWAKLLRLAIGRNRLQIADISPNALNSARIDAEHDLQDKYADREEKQALLGLCRRYKGSSTH